MRSYPGPVTGNKSKEMPAWRAGGRHRDFQRLRPATLRRTLGKVRPSSHAAPLCGGRKAAGAAEYSAFLLQVLERWRTASAPADVVLSAGCVGGGRPVTSSWKRLADESAGVDVGAPWYSAQHPAAGRLELNVAIPASYRDRERPHWGNVRTPYRHCYYQTKTPAMHAAFQRRTSRREQITATLPLWCAATEQYPVRFRLAGLA